MVHKAVRLAALHGIWRRVLINESAPNEFVPAAVHIQLSAIIAKGIADLEIDLLSTLQGQILGTEGPGKENMLPIWTRLWLLILTYRETVDAWRSPQHDQEGLPQLARHMYDILVSLYSGLFRPSSPFKLNWMFDDIYELFGRDRQLMASMGTVKTELTQFGKNTSPASRRQWLTSGIDKLHGHSHPKDVLLRKLMFEGEMKALKPRKYPLSQKYYESSRVYYPLRVKR